MTARLVTALSLLFVICSADNCKILLPYMQLQTTLPKYCTEDDGQDPNSCTEDSCDCGNCCTSKEGTCYAAMNGGKSCADGEQEDESKRATELGTGNYSDVCCMAKPSANTCSNSTIYMRAVTANTFCATDEGMSTAKLTNIVKEDASDFKAQCCDTKVKCDTATCKPGKKLKENAGTTTCDNVPCDEDDGDCCEKDDTTCYGIELYCADGSMLPKSKRGVQATTATFNETCCFEQTTCELFKASTSITPYDPSGRLGAAPGRSAPTFGMLFLAMLGVSA